MTHGTQHYLASRQDEKFWTIDEDAASDAFRPCTRPACGRATRHSLTHHEVRTVQSHREDLNAEA